MTWKEAVESINGMEVFFSGLVGGLISWLVGSKETSFRHAVVMVAGGAFAAEYLTSAIQMLSGYDFPDRAVGFLVGMLSMRITDILVEVLEQGAKNPRYLLDIVVEVVAKRFRK
jgi:hypothetical protein